MILKQSLSLNEDTHACNQNLNKHLMFRKTSCLSWHWQLSVDMCGCGQSFVPVRVAFAKGNIFFIQRK